MLHGLYFAFSGSYLKPLGLEYKVKTVRRDSTQYLWSFWHLYLVWYASYGAKVMALSLSSVKIAPPPAIPATTLFALKLNVLTSPIDPA